MRHALALLMLTPFIAVAADMKQGPIDVKVTLQPGKIHEECTRMEAGAKRKYHWKASAPVDFNIHYHRGSEVSYPIKRDAMRGDGGTFSAKAAEDYCWMWTAREPGTVIEGAITP